MIMFEFSILYQSAAKRSVEKNNHLCDNKKFKVLITKICYLDLEKKPFFFFT